MSIPRIFNSLRIIALFQFLSTDKFITSSKIRELFPKTYEKTLYQRLGAFHSSGLIEKLEKKGDRAGEDRREYKLTPEGNKIKKKLNDYN